MRLGRMRRDSVRVLELGAVWIVGVTRARDSLGVPYLSLLALLVCRRLVLDVTMLMVKTVPFSHRSCHFVGLQPSRACQVRERATEARWAEAVETFRVSFRYTGREQNCGGLVGSSVTMHKGPELAVAAWKQAWSEVRLLSRAVEPGRPLLTEGCRAPGRS